MSTIPTVKQIVKVYEAGVTMPLLCMIEPNDTLVVVKYPFNPFGNHVLVNEWIAHSIAQAISAPIPPFGCCILDETSGYGTEYLQNSEIDGPIIDNQNYGICFFSTFIHNTIPLNRTCVPRLKNKNDFYIMLLLDYIVGNIDRHRGNILYCGENQNFYAIDYSNIFNSQRGWSAETLKDEIQKKDYKSPYLLDKSCNGKIYNLFWSDIDFKKLHETAETIKSILTHERLLSIMETIPESWHCYITIEDQLLLIEYLYNRIQNIEVFCTFIEQGGR